MVPLSQLRNVLLQMGDRGQGGRLFRLESNSRIKVGIYRPVVIHFLRRCRGRQLLVLGGEEGALESNSMEWARVGIHLFGTTGYQVCAVAGVQLEL